MYKIYVLCYKKYHKPTSTKKKKKINKTKLVRRTIMSKLEGEVAAYGYTVFIHS